METQEVNVPENSNCLSLKLEISKCSGCRFFEEDQKLKPGKKRTKRQTCIKPWEKANLLHPFIVRVEHCQKARKELQDLGLGIVGNFDSKIDLSYGTPSSLKQRATKRFIDEQTPRSVIKVQRGDTEGGKHQVRGVYFTDQEPTNHQELDIGFFSPSRIVCGLKRAKTAIVRALLSTQGQIHSSTEEDLVATQPVLDEEEISTPRSLFHSADEDYNKAETSPDLVTESHTFFSSSEQKNLPLSEYESLDSPFSISSANLSNKHEKDRIIKMLFNIHDRAAKDPESGLQDIILSSAERMTKTKRGLDAVEFKRDNQHSGFALFTSGYKTFKSWNNSLNAQRKELMTTTGNYPPHRFQQFVSFLGKEQTDDKLENEPKGARFILNGMKRWYPSTTKNFVDNEAKNTTYKKMTALETGAILSYANISVNAWKRVCRLMSAYKGLSLSASNKDLKQLTSRAPNFFTSYYEYEFDKLKDKERIDYFVIEIPHLIEMLVARELAAKLQDFPFVVIEKESGRPEPEHLPRFGYKTHEFRADSANGCGVYALFTSDHGKGASLGVVRLLLETSNERRDKKNADYGTVSFPFYRMVCKKDPGEVISVLSPYVNRGLKVLNESKLIAVRNQNNEVRCFLVPKDATIMTVEKRKECVEQGRISKLICRYTIASEFHCAETDVFDFDTDHLEFWTAIYNFDSCGIADLLFVLAAQGREGMSTARCMRCNLKKSQWSDKDQEIEARNITFADLTPHNFETLGCKSLPIWNFCPLKWLQPLMHENMGMVNKVYFRMVSFLLTKLDSLSVEESDNRLELENLLDLHETKEDHLNSFNHNLAFKRSELTKRKAEMQRQKNRGKKRGNVQMQQNANETIISIEKVREDLKKEQRELINDIDAIADTITEIKSRLKAFVEDRSKRKDTLDGKIENILQSHQVVIKAFHGGHLTGMACRLFLKKEAIIMAEIKAVCHEAQEERVKEKLPFTIISKEEVDEMLLNFSETFQLIDATFAGLRIIAPTEEEIDFTKRAMILLEYYWVEILKLSETPKAHTVFRHSINDNGTGDVQRFGGLGDKTDEWGEKWHQTMDKQANKVRGMIGFKSQSKTMINNLWRDSDPKVRKRLNEGLASSTRGIYKKIGSKGQRETRRSNVIKIEKKCSA